MKAYASVGVWIFVKPFHSGVEFDDPREMTEKSDGKASVFILAWSLATATPDDP